MNTINLSSYDVRRIASATARIVVDMLAEQRKERYLDTREAASFCGCSKSKIYNNIKSIPHINDGRLKFTESGLTAWMENSNVNKTRYEEVL